MNEQFLIERNGKRFVLFAGLLDEAHNRGLRSIDTELVQAPCAGNGDVAIVRAVVKMGTPDRESGVFTGIGDASPANVGKNIAPHLLRMAETRSKARALRDAINVSAAAFEELGGVDAEDAGSRSDRRPDKTSGGSRRNQRSQGDTGGQGAGQNRGHGERGNVSGLPATRKQLNYLTTLIEDISEEGGAGMAKFEEMVGKKFAELTCGEASEWIGRLSGRSA